MKKILYIEKEKNGSTKFLEKMCNSHDGVCCDGKIWYKNADDDKEPLIFRDDGFEYTHWRYL